MSALLLVIFPQKHYLRAINGTNETAMIKKLIVIVCLFTFIGGNVIYAQSSAVKKIIEIKKK